MFSRTLCVVLMLLGFAAMAGNNDYMSLDREIVKAYNSDPKKAKIVYVNSMHILEQAVKDGSTTGTIWALKARKLITVACFIECTRSVDKKLYRDAYVWARRGVKTGTDFGKIGKNPVKTFYDYLQFASRELANTPMVKNTPKKLLDSQINNYDNILAVLNAPEKYLFCLR